jgi:ABC-type sugar transport system ATPase subunit
MAEVTLEEVTKIFGEDVVAVDKMSLDIPDGEFIVFVGPSGCGKSTALRMIAGLEDISSGKIFIGDQVVNDLPPRQRDIAMVFQNYALYPHMNVRENMGFALKLRKMDKSEISEAQGALRRPEAAGGPRACHSSRAEGVPHGRAPLQPRRQTEGADEDGDRQAAQQDRDN